LSISGHEAGIAPSTAAFAALISVKAGPGGMSSMSSLPIAARRKGVAMNVKLRIQRGSAPLFEGTYDVRDAGSFGEACADAWTRIRTQRLETAPNVGAVMDLLDTDVLAQLDGAEITVKRI
jgi:hypothetical protein